MRFLPAWLCLLSMSGVLTAAEITTLKGQKHSGEIVSIDDKAVVLKTATGEVSTPVPEVLQLTLPPAAPVKPPAKFVDVELVDGSLLHCREFTLAGKQLQLVVLPDLKLTLPTASVSYILIDAQNPATRKEWDAIVSERTKSDRFFVRQNNRLDGLEGTFGDASADGKEIDFTNSEGKVSKLPVGRFAALLYNNRLEGNIAPTVCRIVDAAGNSIVATKAVLKGAILGITSVAGVAIDYPSLQTVAMLDYSKDKIVFLSDLKPSAEDKAFDELSVLYSKDVNLDNQPIQLDGVVHGKGLVLHPPLALTYDIGGEYKDLKVVVGVETSVQTPSHVRLIFEGDGRKLFETEVKVKDKARAVVLDVKKIRQLKIRVSAEGFPFGHQVTLADAKVSK